VPDRKTHGPNDDATLLLKHGSELVDVAKTAQRNKKSLSGDNFYGQKFHGYVVAARSVMGRLDKVLGATSIDASAWDDLQTHVDTLCSAQRSPRGRRPH
jgi:hypothetical protein